MSADIYLVNCTKSTTPNYCLLWEIVCSIHNLKEIDLCESHASLFYTSTKLHKFFNVKDFLFLKVRYSWLMYNVSLSSMGLQGMTKRMQNYGEHDPLFFALIIKSPSLGTWAPSYEFFWRLWYKKSWNTDEVSITQPTYFMWLLNGVTVCRKGTSQYIIVYSVIWSS
jgi:hypothetical protein